MGIQNNIYNTRVSTLAVLFSDCWCAAACARPPAIRLPIFVVALETNISNKVVGFVGVDKFANPGEIVNPVTAV